MPAETHNGYFRNFVSDKAKLPQITHEEMLRDNLCIAPRPLRAYLREAKDFLMNADGPNLEHRRITAPLWFNYWYSKLSREIYPTQIDVLKCGPTNTPVEFDELPNRLKDWMGLSGVIFVAGGEGHEGHIHVAKHMKRQQVSTIWGFEGDEYNMLNKVRGGTYLPLVVRLSMWTIWGLNYVTVLPTKSTDTDTGTHYDELFRRSGSDIYFVTEDDPAFESKSKRGRQLPWRIIPAYRPPSTSERVMRVTWSTSPMVKGLMNESESRSVGTTLPIDDYEALFSTSFGESTFEE